MKRILLLSDSHGNIQNMVTAVNTEMPDMILHMGDCWNDAMKLKRKFPGIPLEKVVGNCDWDQGPDELMITVEGKKIMMCHGHRYGVKSSLLSLELAAREKGADIVLFGHTHHVFYDVTSDLILMNPGSIGCPPRDVPPSYGMLIIGDDGKVSLKTAYLEEQ